MKWNALDEKTMMEYLLGELDEEKRNTVEERYFADDMYFEQLLAVEDDLINKYLGGELSLFQSENFEKSLLSSPERRKKVEFAKMLREYIAEQDSPDPKSFAEKIFRWRLPFSALSSNKFVVGFSFAAVVLLLIFSNLWWNQRNSVLRSRISLIESEQLTWQEQERVLREQNVIQQEQLNQLTEQLEQEKLMIAQLQEDIRDSRLPLPSVISFELFAGLTRSAEDQNPLILFPNTRIVELQMEIPVKKVYQNYVVVLETVEGREILRQQGLQPLDTPRGKFAVLLLPASTLFSDTFILTLQGMIAPEETEVISTYTFDLLKK